MLLPTTIDRLDLRIHDVRALRRLALLAALLAAPGWAQAQPPPPSDPAAPPAALTRPPRPLNKVEAVDPPSLAERGTVDVVLDIDIDETGKVVKVGVHQSGGEEYDRAAVAAAEQFLFSPGYAGDTPVPVRIAYRFHFVYKPPAAAPAEPASVEGAPPAAAAAPETTEFGGKVLRMGDRTPVAGATLSIDAGPGTEPIVTRSEPDGSFAFSAVPLGEHKIKVGGPGLVAQETSEKFSRGKKLISSYFVFEKERYASVVRGRRLVKETVEQTLQMEEIKRIPGTQGDALKAVQNLPGVARSPFGGGQLIVWGSRPDDTRVFVDDVSIGSTLYHFFGVRAVLPTEMVQSLTFAPGGYGADHGLALGGIVQIDSTAPRSDGYHGFVQVDLFDAAFRVEGPITRKLDFSVSARRSWLDAFLPLITPNDFQLSPKYYDYQGKLKWRPTPRDDFELFLFGSDDLVTVATKGPNPASTAAFDSHIFFHRGLARWSHRFEDGAQLNVTGSLGYDTPFQFGAQFGNNSLSVDVRSCPYNLKATYRKPLTPYLRLDAGLDFEGTRYGATATSPLSGTPREDSAPAGGGLGAILSGKENAFTNVVVPYAVLNFAFFEKKLTIAAGLRLTIIEDNGSYDFTIGGLKPDANLIKTPSASFTNAFFFWEPRLSVRYQLVKEFALKGAIGFYSQPPSASTLFGPFGNPNARPETAIHYVAGFDVQPYQTLSISVEGFYKDLRDIVVGNTASSDPAVVNEGIGRVFGLEALVRQQLYKGFFAWISYTLSRSERKDHPDTANWRVFQYDQTHILTAIASYEFPRGYTLGLRFRYVTGNPYTPVVGGYVTANGGGYAPINGGLYSGRLGSFQQLDLRFDKKWTFKRVSFTLYLDIQNLLNASNPEGYQYNYNFTQSKPVAGLPFFPDLGLRVDF